MKKMKIEETLKNLTADQLRSLLPSPYHWVIERRIIELQREELPEEYGIHKTTVDKILNYSTRN